MANEGLTDIMKWAIIVVVVVISTRIVVEVLKKLLKKTLEPKVKGLAREGTQKSKKTGKEHIEEVKEKNSADKV